MPASGRPARGAIGLLVSGLAVCGGLGLCVGVGVGAASASPALGTVVIADVGPAYAVTAQGPLDASQFATDLPDPAAASSTLTTLTAPSGAVSTYARAWHSANGLDRVQDLLVRFPSASGATAFERTAWRTLDRGEIVQAGPLPSIPGARRVTYFAAARPSGEGVGEVISMRTGPYVALLTFFSAAAGNNRPISPGDGVTVARAQQRAMETAAGAKATGGGSATPPTTKRNGTSSAAIGWAVLAVAVLMVAVATPLLLRRRRDRAAALRSMQFRTAEPAPGPAHRVFTARREDT